MSLVAYTVSSDEDSNDSDADPETQEVTGNGDLNGHISDDDEYEVPAAKPKTKSQSSEDHKRLLNLPAPRTANSSQDDLSEDSSIPSFDNLPAPKKPTVSEIIEEDDEFLHKKEIPPDIEKPPAPIAPKKAPVKITIPSLSEFKDLDKKKVPTVSLEPGPSTKLSGLLNLLPKPKNEIILGKASENATTSKSSVTSLIPDSVKHRAATQKIQPSSGPSHSMKPPPKQPAMSLVDAEDSDDDDEADFFSLNSELQLPEVSETEVQTMIAKRVAKMAEAKKRIDQMIEPQLDEEEMTGAAEFESYPEPSQSENVAFDDRAMQALVGGSRAKRQKFEKVNVVELSANEVLPNKGEWLRTALASSTSYQPMGVLVDEEPAPGTRKKHQITYLAHQAKANEMELQAMWSANRHTKRQTQAKYGF